MGTLSKPWACSHAHKSQKFKSAPDIAVLGAHSVIVPRGQILTKNPLGWYSRVFVDKPVIAPSGSISLLEVHSVDGVRTPSASAVSYKRPPGSELNFTWLCAWSLMQIVAAPIFVPEGTSRTAGAQCGLQKNNLRQEISEGGMQWSSPNIYVFTQHVS